MKIRRSAQAMTLLAVLCIAAPGSAADPPPAAAEIKSTVESILDAPEFQTETTVYRWKWRGAQEQATDKEDALLNSAWMRRLAEFVDWLARAMEALLWALAILALVLIYLRRDRWLHLLTRQRAAPRLQVPGYFSGLDIRPEQLPEDVVAAAREAWENGNASGAMSLLYRAALSRLIFSQQLALPASATEGDCVRVVHRQCAGPLAEYFGVLTRSWQYVAYAGRPPSPESAHWLLENFDHHFGEGARP